MNPIARSRTARMPRSVTLALLFAGATVGAPRSAGACSCAPPPPPREALADADAVFEGRVVGIARPDAPVAGGGSITVRFHVTQAWKGEVGETVEVRTAENGAACGYAFADGESYLVYAYASRRGLSTGLCSRTRRAAEAAEDRAALGAGAIPVEVREEPEGAEDALTAPPGGGCAGCIVNDSRPLVPRWALVSIVLLLLSRRALRRRTRS